MSNEVYKASIQEIYKQKSIPFRGDSFAKDKMVEKLKSVIPSLQQAEAFDSFSETLPVYIEVERADGRNPTTTSYVDIDWNILLRQYRSEQTIFVEMPTYEDGGFLLGFREAVKLFHLPPTNVELTLATPEEITLYRNSALSEEDKSEGEKEEAETDE